MSLVVWQYMDFHIGTIVLGSLDPYVAALEADNVS
jgi:hypothetical protein